MLKFSRDITGKFRLTNYIDDNFNLEVYASVKARFFKEIYAVRGMDVKVDDIYYSLIKDFSSMIPNISIIENLW